MPTELGKREAQQEDRPA